MGFYEYIWNKEKKEKKQREEMKGEADRTGAVNAYGFGLQQTVN